MLNAVAKLTTDAAGAVADAAGAVADKVADVLPIPHGDKGQDQSEPADVDVSRDQDTEKSKKDKKKQDLSEGPVSRPLATYPTISGDLDHLDLAPASAPATENTASTAEPAGQEAEQDAGPTFETTEKVTTSEGKEEVVTHKDDVAVPDEPEQDKKPHQKKESQQTKTHKDTQKDTEKSTHKHPATQGQHHKKSAPTQGSKNTQNATSQAVTPAEDLGVSKSTSQQPLTAGSQPLPKLSPGKTKWMSNCGGWYPDRAGILHAPGVYINRKPRANHLNPMHKIEVSF